MLTSKYPFTIVLCRIMVSILCMSLATGCTTLKPLALSNPESALSQVKPGDEIRLITRDGKVREFTVKESTAQQLVGESERVNLSDITDLERRQFSIGKTIALAVVATIILGVLTASSSGGWSKGP